MSDFAQIIWLSAAFLLLSSLILMVTRRRRAETKVLCRLYCAPLYFFGTGNIARQCGLPDTHTERILPRLLKRGWVMDIYDNRRMRCWCITDSGQRHFERHIDRLVRREKRRASC